jgi:ectoine hydroxylase-related dioxygenase (phytanoyl-CoA dioxygenase family)
MTTDFGALRRAYAEDGVVLLPGALPPAAVAAAKAAWDWSLAHPGPGASRVNQASDATFYQDLFNPECLTGYRAMLEASPLPAQLAELLETPDLWFFYEQVFLKEGGETRRTPWHQDSSYLSIGGDDLAVAWITFEPMAAADSLEFVRGSHRGPLYNTSRFDIDDETLPINADSALPQLPDIETARDRYAILSFATQPGDVVVFHPKMLHGGAKTAAGQRRSTLTLRFFGADAVYERRDTFGGAPGVGYHARLATGDPFRDEAFLKLV